MRRLAGIGLVELTWRAESVQTTRRARSSHVLWDPDTGIYRELDPQQTPIERAVERRAVRLTALGALVVDRLRPELETGKRIRWASLARRESQ